MSRDAVFGFLGHNGAGKTTTLNMLVTLARPTSGTAVVAGHDLVEDPMGVRRAIGYVPENVRLHDTMTARENLLFLARLSGLEDPEGGVADTLRLLGGSEYADRRVGSFSKENTDRLAERYADEASLEAPYLGIAVPQPRARTLEGATP